MYPKDLERPTPEFEELTIVEQLLRRRKALSIKELSEILGIAYRTLHDMAKSGAMPSYKLGGSVRVDPVVIARWMQDREQSQYTKRSKLGRKIRR